MTILLLFYVLVFWPRGMWDLSSLTRDQTCPPALEGKVLTIGPPGKSPDSSLLTAGLGTSQPPKLVSQFLIINLLDIDI